MISEAILAKAMPPGRAPGFYSFRRFRRRIRYSEIAYNGVLNLCRARFKLNYLYN
jgi:hypothetical protein